MQIFSYSISKQYGALLTSFNTKKNNAFMHIIGKIIEGSLTKLNMKISHVHNGIQTLLLLNIVMDANKGINVGNVMDGRSLNTTL